MASAVAISVETKYLAPSDSSLPALALQVTVLVDSYMLWVGTTECSADDVHKAPLQGSLCKDWACAMPSNTTGTPAPATSLFRSSSSDAALSMARRLARRFRKQIFLSVDVPVMIPSMGQEQKLLLEAERGIVEALKEIEEGSGSSQVTRP